MTTPQMDWLDDERRRLRNAAIRDAAKRMNQVIDNMPIPEAEKESVRTDLEAGARKRKHVINAMSSVDHDYCDGCGQLTVVTDVWIDRCPTTLCQSCILDALAAGFSVSADQPGPPQATAEGEHLGQYWEIET